METNNWKEKAREIAIDVEYINPDGSFKKEEDVIVECMLKAMDLVFEATKKECSYISELFKEQSESILNINKPNL